MAAFVFLQEKQVKVSPVSKASHAWRCFGHQTIQHLECAVSKSGGVQNHYPKVPFGICKWEWNYFFLMCNLLQYFFWSLLLESKSVLMTGKMKYVGFIFHCHDSLYLCLQFGELVFELLEIQFNCCHSCPSRCCSWASPVQNIWMQPWIQ